MKFQLILLSFIVLSSFQLLDVDGLRKASNVSENLFSSHSNHSEQCPEPLNIFNFFSFDMCGCVRVRVCIVYVVQYQIFTDTSDIITYRH